MVDALSSEVNVSPTNTHPPSLPPSRLRRGQARLRRLDELVDVRG